jgi:WD40 repeat protein/DNA-binding SARP family transcriptional activator
MGRGGTVAVQHSPLGGQMEISVLGPVEVSAGGLPVAIDAGKPRALLALLALHEGSTVSTDRLVQGLWGEEPPATAAKMVQLAVSHLRKALANGEDGAEIVTRGRGYELRLHDGGLDARRFEQLIADGMPREALALWRGAPLADLADEPFAAAEARRLEELRVTALELAIEGELAAGRHREVVGELETLVADQPLHERLHVQRMLALYRSGRQADALEAYREARHALVEAIGVEPGPELRRMHEAILRQDPDLDPPEAEAADVPAELVVAATPLAGREADVDWLREHWRRARAGSGRLVIVAGARGMGKTRLAAELADEVHRDRGAVLYASGAGLPTAASAALESAAAARRPTLLVVDDVDRGTDDLQAELRELVDKLAATSVLVVATVEDAQVAAALRAEATLTLAALDADAIGAIARLYAGAHEGGELPVALLAARTGGVPRRIHRAAGEWARTEAARRLEAAAGRAASERAGLRAAEDDLVGNVVELQAVRERALPPPSDADTVVVCPFKGLASFDVEDAGFFFGRERLVAEMVARLAGAPLVGIVGPSGSGKSSALRAGLLPALAEGVLPGSEEWSLALLRPGEHPLRALARATAHAEPHGRLVLAVDQFDEVFTACRDEPERTAFVDALVASARDPRRRALVLVAVRADFYGRCATYPELWRLLGANQVPVGPMRRDELRRAIALPARRAGLEVEPDLTEVLIADVEGESGALPLLSTALLELWQRRDGRRLSLVAYEQSGGVHGAVARMAERAYERLDADEQGVARAIFLRLAGEGGGDAAVGARVALDEFGEDARAVLAELTDSRLLTVSEGEVEVAHEALLREWPRLRGWLEDDAEGRRLHRNLRVAAKEWETGGHDAGELYRGARLASALDWAADHDPELNAMEHAFLDGSRTASERAHRRLRMVLAGVAALLVLAVIAAVVALNERGTARAEAVAADGQRLGAQALTEDDLDRSLLLAREGVALDDSAQTRGNLLAALVKSPAAIGVLRGDGERMWTVALSPDERTLAAGDPAGNVFLFDTRTRRRVATITPGDADSWITQLAFNPDGSRLAIGHDTTPQGGNVVAVLDTRSRRVLRRLKPPPGRFLSALRYAADGRLEVVSVSTDPDPERAAAVFVRFDPRTGARLLGPRRISAAGRPPLLVTSDGRRMVVPGKGEITVRDAETLRRIESFDVSASAPRNPEAYALSPDDRTVAIGDEAGSLRFLDLRTGTVRTASGRHRAGVIAARFTPDGRTLVTGGEDGDVIVWDVRKAAAGETLSGHASGISDLEVGRDERTLYTAGLDGTVFIWDLVGARRLGRPFTAGAGDSQRPYIALSSDGRAIAMGQDDGAISIVDARTLAVRRPFGVVDTGQVLGIGFVPGSRLLVVGGPEGFLALVDTDSGRVIRRLRGHGGRIYTPGISGDGRLLATGSDDNTVRLWSLPDGHRRGVLRFRDDVRDAQLSPDGRWLTVVLVDDDRDHGTVEIWDAHSRRLAHRVRIVNFPGFTRFSPDGRLLAVGDRFNRTQVWSTASWKPVTRWLGGDASGILTAQISPNGRTLATGSDTGILRLWDIESEQAIGAPLPGVPSRAVVPTFTPDGKRLIASYDTGRAYIWDIRPQSLASHACQVAGRRLTRAEWAEFLPRRDYDPAC